MIAIRLNEKVTRPPGVIFVPYAPDHSTYINSHNKDVQAISNVTSLQGMVEDQAAAGEAITVLHHDIPVAVFGLVPIWKGLAELWFIPDEALRRFPVFMLRSARAFIDISAISYDLHRQQITVRCDDEKAIRFAHAIGFDNEGRLEKYGPDQADFFMMSIVRTE